jgi:hypothetical protein
MATGERSVGNWEAPAQGGRAREGVALVKTYKSSIEKNQIHEPLQVQKPDGWGKRKMDNGQLQKKSTSKYFNFVSFFISHRSFLITI